VRWRRVPPRSAGRRKRQSRLQRLRGVQFLPREREIPSPGVHLGGDVVRLGTLRMIAQYLIHHLLRLDQMTCACRVIDLIHGRIGVGRLDRADQSRRKPHQQRYHGVPETGHLDYSR
jgi:hypothetical protein